MATNNWGFGDGYSGGGAGGGGSDLPTLYTANGKLPENREVDLNGKSLTFKGASYPTLRIIADTKNGGAIEVGDNGASKYSLYSNNGNFFLYGYGLGDLLAYSKGTGRFLFKKPIKTDKIADASGSYGAPKNALMIREDGKIAWSDISATNVKTVSGTFDAETGKTYIVSASSDAAGNLPDPTQNTGAVIRIRSVDGITTLLCPAGLDDGGIELDSIYKLIDGDAVTMVSDGATWRIIEHHQKTPKSFYEYESATVNINTSWKVIKEWSPFVKRKGTALKLSFRVPFRNDNTGWGGAYLLIQVRLDGGSVKTIFHSGYDAVMASGARAIASMSHTFLYDTQELLDAKEVEIIFRSRTYQGTGKVNGSHAISSYPGQPNAGFMNVTIEEVRV